MSRYARRREPNLPRKERVELNEGNIPLRIFLVGLSIAIAVIAFSTVSNLLMTVKPGWQTVEAGNPETGIHENFTLSYNIGQGSEATNLELKTVSTIYTEVLDHAYRVLSSVGMEHYANLYILNHQPNEAITVDPLLYSALETVQGSDSRYLYFSPVQEMYTSLFACTSDTDAQKFDPAFSPVMAEFAAQISAFAMDPDQIQIELLPNQQVMLKISDAYLRFAQENGVERFVDFGILLNAFLCDAAADALMERGYVNGIVNSFDGYARALSGEEFNSHVVTLRDGKPAQLGTAAFSGPAAVVTLRSFPASRLDTENYYTYADGTNRAPYMDTDGLLHSAAESLMVLDTQRSVAELAVRNTAAFAQAPVTPYGASWLLVQDGEMTVSGTGIRAEKVG